MTTVQSKCNLQTNIILWMLIFKCLWIKILYCTRLRLSQAGATQLSTIVIHWVGYFKIWIKKLLELPLFTFLHENILSMQPWQLCMSIINSKHRMWNGCMFICLYDVFEVDWLRSTIRCWLMTWDWMEVFNARKRKRKQLSPELCQRYEAESDWRLGN